MESLKVGIIGCGTVGSGVVKLLTGNKKVISERIGKDIEIAFVADRDVEKVKRLGIPEEKIVDDGFKALNIECDVVVELIGGTTIAKDIVSLAIEKGKHVVTANKALLADYGEELFKKAKKKGVSLKFEASVGGGIPVIKALREGLVGNRIKRIYGIINGTANYILTEMTEKGITFDEALRKAQELGYAEADPTLDVEGYDAAHKIAILSTLSFCRWVKTENVYVRGIKDITPVDIELAREFGYKVKLLAISKLVDEELEVRVHPTMIPEDHILSNVNGVFNACLIEGDFVGDTLYYGKGAGEKPTASAVVSDIVDIAIGNKYFVPECLFKEGDKPKIKAPEEFISSFYLRFTAVDKPGVLAKISKILADYGISIKMALQKSININGGVPVVMTTHPACKSNVQKAIEEIDKLDVILKPTFVCMIEEL
ncbi:homoserine dehydrogenase [Desulfurobacterium thermolithotrophum DSM 11699]|uniref:Homoserine dehydrogenase n=1 Tax=Desulfurobacterium thermolithotrophum (strain DSM 11699 / BSA) TaxID=868864 RepID=F0S0V8_DESTD|nr:homoserine dehydrogenase [Desulfurobacterium thermolithotrophum]ADY72762.1 homoserine dehydrogenase [Desulfurobacterium thermolithotrophum DSM 11699]